MKTRRHFLLSSSMAAAATAIALPRLAVASRPTRPIRVAAVGIGGRGRHNVKVMWESGLATPVAFADIDLQHPSAVETLKRKPSVPTFTDFRKMFDAMDREIDAVVITTPDHSHFPVAMEAIRRGKHVYCEKPLAPTFRETDLLIAAAEASGVVTQMGNQGHSEANYFQAKALAEDGVFDSITSVMAYAGHRKFWRDWTINGYRSQPKPKPINWEVWNAARPKTPFSEALHPGRWRAWQRFGVGILGDWGAHLVDTAHRFMDLGLPETVSTPLREGGNDWIYPHSNAVKMSFPARGKRPPATLTWHDGRFAIPDNAPLQDNGKPMSAAKVFNYQGGRLVGGSHGSPLKWEAKNATEGSSDSASMPALPALSDYQAPPCNHQVNFLRACLGQEEATSPFAVGGPLTQMLLIGAVAQRMGGTLKFDRQLRQFTGEQAELANTMLDGPEVRAGWTEYYG